MASQTGLRVVFNNLPKIAADMRPLADQILAKHAANIERNAKLMSPVDTGFNRANIKAERAFGGWAVTAYAPYSIYLELGTAKMAARPFLIPAYEAELDDLRNDFMRLVK